MQMHPPDTGWGIQVETGSGTAERMVEAAALFFASLNDEEKPRAFFPRDDCERLNWDYRPTERSGLPFRDMDRAQEKLGMALLSAGLSRRGHIQALQIMSLEKVLRELEGASSEYRDPDGYYLTLFGTPSRDTPWGWRVEGHHLSLNFLVINGTEIASTPNFFGANPARVTEGPLAGLRVLAAEEDLARRLLQSLDPNQESQAILAAEAPADIVTGREPRVNIEDPEGIPFSRMTIQQRGLFMELISNYTSRLPPDLADSSMNRIEKDGTGHIHFAWAGQKERGEPHYYRIHGPSFFVEYDNTQNHANHIHTVWRDLTNDWGEDMMKSHYRLSHQPVLPRRNAHKDGTPLTVSSRKERALWRR